MTGLYLIIAVTFWYYPGRYVQYRQCPRTSAELYSTTVRLRKFLKDAVNAPRFRPVIKPEPLNYVLLC